MSSSERNPRTNRFWNEDLKICLETHRRYHVEQQSPQQYQFARAIGTVDRLRARVKVFYDNQTGPTRLVRNIQNLPNFEHQNVTTVVNTLIYNGGWGGALYPPHMARFATGVTGLAQSSVAPDGGAAGANQVHDNNTTARNHD